MVWPAYLPFSCLPEPHSAEIAIADARFEAGAIFGFIVIFDLWSWRDWRPDTWDAESRIQQHSGRILYASEVLVLIVFLLLALVLAKVLATARTSSSGTHGHSEDWMLRA